MAVTDVDDAKAGLLDLIDAAVRGEEVLIALGGVPTVRLVPVHENVPRRRRREPGRLEGQVVELDPDWWKPDDEFRRLFEEGDGPQASRRHGL